MFKSGGDRSEHDGLVPQQESRKVREGDSIESVHDKRLKDKAKTSHALIGDAHAEALHEDIKRALTRKSQRGDTSASVKKPMLSKLGQAGRTVMLANRSLNELFDTANTSVLRANLKSHDQLGRTFSFEFLTPDMRTVAVDLERDEDTGTFGIELQQSADGSLAVKPVVASVIWHSRAAEHGVKSGSVIISVDKVVTETVGDVLAVVMPDDSVEDSEEEEEAAEPAPTEAAREEDTPTGSADVAQDAMVATAVAPATDTKASADGSGEVEAKDDEPDAALAIGQTVPPPPPPEEKDAPPPLLDACGQGKLSVVKKLHAEGMPLDVADEVTGARPIHFACAGGKLETAKWLHAEGIPLDTPDASGAQPIHYACVDGHLDTVKWLVSKVGCAVDPLTPLLSPSLPQPMPHRIRRHSHTPSTTLSLCSPGPGPNSEPYRRLKPTAFRRGFAHYGREYRWRQQTRSTSDLSTMPAFKATSKQPSASAGSEPVAHGPLLFGQLRARPPVPHIPAALR